MTDKKETEKKGMAAADRLRWLPPAVRNIIITAVSAAVLCFCAFAVIRYGSSDGSDGSDSLRRPDESEHFCGRHDRSVRTRPRAGLTQAQRTSCR